MKIVNFNTPFLYLNKYGLPLLFLFIGYSILIIAICYWGNFDNSSLKKKTGIIEDIKMNVVPASSYMWYILNIKLEDDPTWYVQEWQISNNPVMYYFLFGDTKFTKDIYFEKGRHAELYIDSLLPSASSYILKEREESSNPSGRNRYKSIKTPENITALVSCGVTIDNEGILDYKKRDFTSPLYQKLSIGLYLLFAPLFLIGLFYINAILTYLIRRLPI